jgi:hypothetical protein
MPPTPPAVYARELRVLVRFAVAMGLFGLLVGIAYQESAHKLPWEATTAGVHLAAVHALSLVHGHIFTLGVFLPLALAGALVLALRAGGRPLGGRVLAVLRLGYLPFATATVLLQLVKGYVFLLAVRGGETDLAVVDAGFMAGNAVLRYAVYAVVHAGMGVTLGVVLVALWRSLGTRPAG